MAKTRPLLKARNPGTAKRCELVRGEAEDTLYVYGVIGEDFWGDGIASLDIVKAVQQSKAARLNVRINSPGGDVFEGVAMANALRSFKGEVVAHVDGLAASAATLLTTAAKQTLMAKGSMLMIHRAWTFAMGNAQDLLEQAALLEKIDAQIAQGYADRAGVSLDQAIAWMDAETWFTEQEAVAAKLADGLQESAGAGEAKALARQWDLAQSPFAHVPAALAESPDSRATVTVMIDASAARDAIRDALAQAEKERQAAANIAAHERAARIARTLAPESA